MDRRSFLIASLAASAAGPVLAGAGEEYVPGMVTKKLADGEVVLVDFYATWCTTCKRQERVIGALRSQNPDYEAISFVAVDWDQHSRSDLARSLRIPRRSTLVVLTKDGELGRIVAGTSTRDIQALMDVALAAAVA